MIDKKLIKDEFINFSKEDLIDEIKKRIVRLEKDLEYIRIIFEVYFQ